MDAHPDEDQVLTAPSEQNSKSARRHSFCCKKPVSNMWELDTWMRSIGYHDVVQFINNTSMAVRGQRLMDNYVISKQMHALCVVIDWLNDLVDENHPLAGDDYNKCQPADLKPVRSAQFSNTSISVRNKTRLQYRNWLLAVQEQGFDMLLIQLETDCKNIGELSQYLVRSCGSIRTYTYSTSNELMFVFFLCGLFKFNVLNEEDTVAAALLLYHRYVILMRRVMELYRIAEINEFDQYLIDQHYYLAYIWGIAQLCAEPPFKPIQCEQSHILTRYRDHFMLIGCLDKRDHDLRTMPPFKHTYDIWCLLALTKWTDIYSGVIESYIKNVLNDYHTMKTIYCGDLINLHRCNLETLVMPEFDQVYISNRIPGSSTSTIISTRLSDSLAPGSSIQNRRIDKKLKKDKVGKPLYSSAHVFKSRFNLNKTRYSEILHSRELSSSAILNSAGNLFTAGHKSTSISNPRPVERSSSLLNMNFNPALSRMETPSISSFYSV